jgi:hypothetical protein
VLNLSAIYSIIKNATGIDVVFDEGQNVETPPMPYITAALVDEKRYKGFQRMTMTVMVGSTPNKTYAIPVETTMQLGVVYEAGQFVAARNKIRDLYAYMMTDEWRNAMKALDDVSAQIISPIRELRINKAELFERRLTFDVTFHWTDVRTVTGVDIIDTVNVEQVPVTGGI